MYSTYILNQMIDSIRISVYHDITKIWKKSPMLKISTTFIFHINNNNETF